MSQQAAHGDLPVLRLDDKSLAVFGIPSRQQRGPRSENAPNHSRNDREHVCPEDTVPGGYPHPTLQREGQSGQNMDPRTLGSFRVESRGFTQGGASRKQSFLLAHCLVRSPKPSVCLVLGRAHLPTGCGPFESTKVFSFPFLWGTDPVKPDEAEHSRDVAFPP